jgi:type IX secretion system PorP/SprF family membrane protein
MQRLFISILTILLPLQIAGQMLPLYDHYLNNTLAINPAFAGSEDALSASVIYRNQWPGFDGAPVNSILSLHTPVRNDRIGLGFLMMNSTYGVNRETSLIGNYAYRIEINRGILALGLGFGATMYKADWSKLDVADAGDSRLINNPQSAFLPEFSLGIYYYSKKYFAGFSIPMFLSHKMNYSSGKYKITNDFSEYNYLLEAGYYFNLSHDFRLLTSALIKYHPEHVPQVDFNSHLIIYDRIWIGAGYRNNSTIIGLLQVKINQQAKIGYAHDFNTGKLATISSSSHEFVLNYLFSFSRKVEGPRQF